MPQAEPSSAENRAIVADDAALRAIDRLEGALERLFDLLEARFARMEDERVPRAEVEELSRRLDETLERLKVAMAEQQQGEG